MSVTLSDPRITESSGFAFSTVHEDLAYTLNDEDGVLFTVQPSTGKTIGTFKLPYKLVDPESLRCHDGYLYILDAGDNDLKRKTYVLYKLLEPGSGNLWTLPKSSVKRFVFVYPDGKSRNCETLLISPKSGLTSVLTKASGHGSVFFFPNPLPPAGTFKLQAGSNKNVPELVTDGDYARSGTYILVVQKTKPGMVTVLDLYLKPVHTISTKKLRQCESISVSPDGTHALVGSEGTKSPLVTVPIPPAYR